jgi:hypothetical protein
VPKQHHLAPPLQSSTQNSAPPPLAPKRLAEGTISKVDVMAAANGLSDDTKVVFVEIYNQLKQEELIFFAYFSPFINNILQMNLGKIIYKSGPFQLHQCTWRDFQQSRQTP